jgi:hypothetical protein
MADNPPVGKKHVSLQDLIRPRNSLGKNITWGGSSLNALEVEKLTELTAEDYARIRKEYNDFRKPVTIINTFVLVLWETPGSAGEAVEV